MPLYCESGGQGEWCQRASDRLRPRVATREIARGLHLFRTVLFLRLRGELTGSRSALRRKWRRFAPAAQKSRPQRFPRSPPLTVETRRMNARHGTRAAFLFLQMQRFLQDRGYVNSG